jgi:hypothetical protein
MDRSSVACSIVSTSNGELNRPQGVSSRSLTNALRLLAGRAVAPTQTVRQDWAPTGERVAAVILLIRSWPSLQPFAAWASSKRNGR